MSDSVTNPLMTDPTTQTLGIGVYETHQERFKWDRIPFDIREEVFFHCLPSDEYIQPSAFTAPLLLCQVDKAWREITMSMPKLWSMLSVKIGRRGCIPHTSLITKWLLRAGPHPLSISLTLDRRPGPAAFTNVDSALRSLLPFFATWKHINIQVGPFLNLDTFNQLPDTFATAPHLDGLEIYLPGSYNEAANGLTRFFHRAHRLRKLQLGAEVSGSYIPELKVPFGNLTCLSLLSSVFSIDNCCAVLEQCPNLVQLQLYQLEGNFEHVRSGPPIVLQHLETFSMATTTQHLNIFFDTFTFPLLVNLRCHCHYPFPTRSFLNLLDRSACVLSKLLLTTDLTQHDLLKCLQACPSLLVLSLKTTNGPYVTDRVLERLTFGNLDSPLCSLLESITFGPGSIFSSDGKLANMIESRFFLAGDSRPRQILKFSVAVEWAHTQDLSRVRELKRLGLDISSEDVEF